MKKQFIKDLKADDLVEDTFVVTSKNQIRNYSNKPGIWFPLSVSDKTGSMQVKFWGNNDEQTNALFLQLKPHDVVFIKGQVKDFNGLAINVDPTSGELKKTEDYDRTDYVATTKKDPEQMKSDLKKIMAEIKNNDIQRLLNSFFNDDGFMEEFSKSPAASSRHHNYIGGLLEHVLSLIKISKNIIEIHPELDGDLLIAGCILHDIGKMKEYEVKTSIGYSDEGILIGHISIGQKMVADKIEKLGNFPDILKNKIIHMILSHHGMQEWGSPVKPAFPEAIALHYMDQCDAKIKGALQEKEKANPEDEWTNTKDFGKMYLE